MTRHIRVFALIDLWMQGRIKFALKSIRSGDVYYNQICSLDQSDYFYKKEILSFSWTVISVSNNSHDTWCSEQELFKGLHCKFILHIKVAIHIILFCVRKKCAYTQFDICCESWTRVFIKTCSLKLLQTQYIWQSWLVHQSSILKVPNVLVIYLLWSCNFQIALADHDSHSLRQKLWMPIVLYLS